MHEIQDHLCVFVHTVDWNLLRYVQILNFRYSMVKQI